jgi:hypothetical protein
MKFEETWQQRERRIADEFTGSMDWSKVFCQWRSRLSDFRVEPWPLFHEIILCDARNPTQREPDTAWWEAGKVDEEHLLAQDHLNKWPGTRGRMSDDGHGKGCAQTLSFLREFGHSAERVAAILILASIRSRHGSRNTYPIDRWPPTFAYQDLIGWCGEVSELDDGLREWHFAMTDVLPVCREERMYEIENMPALVNFFAEEHAQLLSTYRAVIAEYRPEPDPWVYRRIRNAERAKERQLQQERHEEAERLKKLRAEHPRWGEWDSVSRAELERLVWTKPVSQLAAEFGVSDVGIANRCKKLAIARPPRGFWLRVKSGKIEHPNGKPS